MGEIFLGAEHEVQWSQIILYWSIFGTFLQCNVIAIGLGSDGADSSLQEKYSMDLTLKESETIALSIVKQVMKEKVKHDNSDITKVSPTYHIYASSDVEAVINCLWDAKLINLYSTLLTIWSVYMIWPFLVSYILIF